MTRKCGWRTILQRREKIHEVVSIWYLSLQIRSIPSDCQEISFGLTVFGRLWVAGFRIYWKCFFFVVKGVMRMVEVFRLSAASNGLWLAAHCSSAKSTVRSSNSSYFHLFGYLRYSKHKWCKSKEGRTTTRLLVMSCNGIQYSRMNRKWISLEIVAQNSWRWVQASREEWEGLTVMAWCLVEALCFIYGMTATI